MMGIENRSDAELIAASRLDDSGAVAELWRRHRDSVTRAAAAQSDRMSAEDLASEAFDRVFAALRSGHGPSRLFRPYIFAVVRHLAIRQGKANARLRAWDDHVDGEHSAPAADAALTEDDRHAVRRAFGSLPERWRTALWLMHVEGLPVREIARRMTLSSTGVSSLAYRARLAFRAAWVQDHVPTCGSSRSCRAVLEQLGGYEAGTLTRTQRHRVDAHVRSCTSCQDAVRRVQDATGIRVVPSLRPPRDASVLPVGPRRVA